jgi:hypothetical protein
VGQDFDELAALRQQPVELCDSDRLWHRIGHTRPVYR